MKKRKINAIIFDLNGVFIISPKLSERFEKDFNVPVKKFIPALKTIMGKLRLPNAGGIYKLWKPFLDSWNVGLSEYEFLDYWFRAEKENTTLTDLARILKSKGLSLIILSNNFQERSEYYANNFSFFSELFDGVYYSWQTGFVKPSIEAFQNVLNKHNLKPSECLFFDDSENNIEVAKRIGIESYIFDEAAVKMLETLA